MEWYYAINNQRQGPISEDDLRKLVGQGVIRSETLVWRTGFAEWQQYGKVAAESTGSADLAPCAVSGRWFPKKEMVPYEGQWISAECRDAFFQRIHEGVPLPGLMIYGNFWPRFGAKFLDGIIMSVVGGIINFFLALLFGGALGTSAISHSGRVAAGFVFFQGTLILINQCLRIGYTIFFYRKYSATPGKLALGLKLVRSDGSPVTVWRIVGRYFAEMLTALTFFVGYIIAAFDEEKRTLHDRICDTRVIKSR